jgi:hypothetical protein
MFVQKKEPFAVRWSRTGAFERWFSWIQAQGLTAGLFALSQKATNSETHYTLIALGSISLMLLWSWTMGWCLIQISARLPKRPLAPSLAYFFAAIIAVPLSVSVTALLALVLIGLLR